MNKITGGVDISLNYEGKDLPDLGLSKKGGRTVSAAGGDGETSKLDKQKLASLSLMNKVRMYLVPSTGSLSIHSACKDVADIRRTV